MARRGLLGSSAEASGEAQEADPAEVARVAYELWQQRGGRHGSDQEDWFKAETIVRQRAARGPRTW